MMGEGTGTNAGERDVSARPAGWDDDHVAAYETFMRHKLKNGSTLREDTPGDRGHELASYRVAWDGNNIVLPAAGRDEADALGFTSRDDSADTLERFTRELLSGKSRSRRRGPTLAPVALLHRADNTYNRRAVAVATPASSNTPPAGRASRGHVADARSRHLGYLSDRFLREVGVETLPALAQLAGSRGGEIQCTGMVFDVADLMLDLPVERVLLAAIEAFLAEHGIDAWQKPRRHTSRSEQTTRAQHHIRTYDHNHAGVEVLTLGTVVAEHGHRTLTLTDPRTLRHIGDIVDRYLLLDDERDRPQVLALLALADVPVTQPAQPAPATGTASTEQWPPDLVPNLRARFAPGAVLVQTDDPVNSRYERIAIYNRSTGRLWVEDGRLAGAAATFVARLGIAVSSIGLPEEPWQLDREVPRHMLSDTHAPPPTPRDVAVHLIAANRSLVGEHILAPVAWHKRPRHQSPGHEPEDHFWVLERHVRERTILFPGTRLTLRKAPCRLCGQTTAEFTALVCEEPLAYCHDCLLGAAEGKSATAGRERAARAVRALAELEFDGVPMLEDQLATLHVNPARPAPATRVDQLLLLRFAIRRGKYPWTHVLEQSGIAPEGLRTSRGTLVRARDGHLCLSLRERAVCDFLHQHDIDHDREPLYPTDEVLNPHGRRRADWILTDGTLVELWGMPNDPAYAAKMVEKRQLAQRLGIRLVELTDADLPHLPRMFADWLSPDALNGDSGDATVWTWSPATITSAATTARKTQQDVERAAARDAAGPNGRRDVAAQNSYNIRARSERVARSQRALELATAGHTRNQIAAELGVSPDAARELVRDARFYADPATDPARRELAVAAAIARRTGQTRAKFAAEHQLSESKAKGTWRDAEILNANPAGP